MSVAPTLRLATADQPSNVKAAKIALPLVLLLAAGAYKFVLAKPAEAGQPAKVAGAVAGRES